eukprot:TRINITY_DN6597_c0_g1_i1.p3 TRINITY_DN6597_c0_g1~~TRINITY_DN6597_c0_g1_i1.p3  ORF type:complete len:224 (-),score=30.80 TRINITY_DN6597_c0_g1_i1:2079-2750(-)
MQSSVSFHDDDLHRRRFVRQTSNMSSWGVNNKYDVLVYALIILFSLGALACLATFIGFLTDKYDQHIASKYALAFFFVLFNFGNCMGCLYFCTCSQTRKELEIKDLEVASQRNAPLVIPYRRYQKQNSRHLKNVIYKSPSTKSFKIEYSELSEVSMQYQGEEQEEHDENDSMKNEERGKDKEGEKSGKKSQKDENKDTTVNLAEENKKQQLDSVLKKLYRASV